MAEASTSVTASAECELLQLPQTVDNGRTREGLEVQAHLLEREPTIHRFPSNLLRFGTERDYIAPSAVSIGPYYHDVPKLQAMEVVKLTVMTDYFFEELPAGSRAATYEEIKLIARDARICYTDTDALKGITDDEFSAIMFMDGCFLVQFINYWICGSGVTSLDRIIGPHSQCVWRDIMLLENQIPWAVMEVLMPLKRLTTEKIVSLVSKYLHGTVSNIQIDIQQNYRPGHLLCLIRFSEASSTRDTRTTSNQDVSSMYTCAAELAEVGIKLEASHKMKISDISLVKGHLCAKLILAPLNLDAAVKSWLVNMAAFEMWVESLRVHDCYVNSYIAVLCSLMNREEDVRELRTKSILRGFWSDRQTLEFFNDLAQNISEGQAYPQLIVDLAEYRKKRQVWIAIYRFFYKNRTTIAKVLSIMGVLAGIFKALY